MLKSSMKITPQPFCPAFLPAFPTTTLKIRTPETTILTSVESPHPPVRNGVAGAKVSVSEPGIFAHVKTPCSSFKITTCVSVDPKKLEVLQNQRLQKIWGKGSVIVNQDTAESSAAPSLAVSQCSEASPMAAAIGSSFPAPHSLLHSSNTLESVLTQLPANTGCKSFREFVSPLDATLTKNGGGGWQDHQSVSSSATPIIPVLTTRRSRLATFVSRATHYSLFTTHWSFPCA
jgi:hypothetical protein